MLSSRNKLMLHLRQGHPTCTTRTAHTSIDQASATKASAINQTPATEALATNQALATAADRNQHAAPVAAQSTQTRASPARTSQHLRWTAPAYRPAQRFSPHPSAIAFAIIASTTCTLTAVSAVSSAASLVARRGTVTSATAAVAAASVVALSPPLTPPRRRHRQSNCQNDHRTHPSALPAPRRRRPIACPHPAGLQGLQHVLHPLPRPLRLHGQLPALLRLPICPQRT